MRFGILPARKDITLSPKCTISKRQLVDLLIRNAIAACVVFDVTNKDTFEKCQQWVQELHEKALPEILITIVGNKIDLDSH